MKRSLGRAAVIAGVALFVHGVLVLSSWVDGWTVSEQFESLTTGYLALVLMGLVSLAALTDWRIRRRRGGPSLWWRPVARAFGGAALFSVAALISGLPFRLAHPIGLLMRCLWWGGRLGFPWIYMGNDRITFLLVTAGVMALILRQWRRENLSLRIRTKPARRLVGLPLLTGLAVALHALWIALVYVGPDLLIAPLGYRSMCGYVTCYWYRASSGFAWPSRDVVLQAVDLFAGVTLLLWLFQLLWWRLTTWHARTSVACTPTYHL